jgi:hypothetical protein
LPDVHRSRRVSHSVRPGRSRGPCGSVSSKQEVVAQNQGPIIASRCAAHGLMGTMCTKDAPCVGVTMVVGGAAVLMIVSLPSLLTYSRGT